MAQNPPTDSDTAFTIVSTMTDHGGMTVVESSTNRTYQIVEYDSESLRSELASRNVGDSVSLELDRAGVRANVWRVSHVEPAVLAA